MSSAEILKRSGPRDPDPSGPAMANASAAAAGGSLDAAIAAAEAKIREDASPELHERWTTLKATHSEDQAARRRSVEGTDHLPFMGTGWVSIAIDLADEGASGDAPPGASGDAPPGAPPSPSKARPAPYSEIAVDIGDD